MDLLEQAIAATPPDDGAKVVSEQHDPNAINWVRGMSDPGEMIACGAYQELRRHEGEQDAAYAARIGPLVAAMPAAHRKKLEKAMKGAALKRASLTVANGRVSLLVAGGEPPWTGLGVHYDRPLKSKQAIVEANLNRTVVKVPRTYAWGDEVRDPGDCYALVYEDDGHYLNTVGGKYQIIQAEDAFAYLDDVLEEFGAQIATAGAVYNGKKIWIQAKLPQGFTLPGGDETCCYATVMNTHGGEAGRFYPSGHRVECANTMRISLGKDKDRGFTIRHTGNIREKVNKARALLGLSVKGFDSYKEHAEHLYRAPLAVAPYASGVLDKILGVTETLNALEEKRADPLTAALELTEAEKAVSRVSKRYDLLLDEVLAAYDHPSNARVPGGTAWRALNAMTYVADHGSVSEAKRGSAQDRLSRRFESILDGDADTLKQAAYAAAVDLTRN